VCHGRSGRGIFQLWGWFFFFLWLLDGSKKRIAKDPGGREHKGYGRGKTLETAPRGNKGKSGPLCSNGTHGAQGRGGFTQKGEAKVTKTDATGPENALGGRAQNAIQKNKRSLISAKRAGRHKKVRKNTAKKKKKGKRKRLHTSLTTFYHAERVGGWGGGGGGGGERGVFTPGETLGCATKSRGEL